MKRRGFTLLEVTVALSLLAGLLLVLVGLFRATLQASFGQLRLADRSSVVEALWQVEEGWHHRLPAPDAPLWLDVVAGERTEPAVLLKGAWLDEDEALAWQALALVAEDAWGSPRAKPSLAVIRKAPAAADSLAEWEPLIAGERTVLVGPLDAVELEVGRRNDGVWQPWPREPEQGWRLPASDAVPQLTVRVRWQAGDDSGVLELAPLLSDGY
ncbi:MAG: prepilin-type N-terminal cleavage/methylation domain-containing protein [Verrucomicrobiota bacterium JB022]|nr:prepilin-type N-terminal cleavage/methylation domain-containing protein [Verrucomicrobiota bacterium JB022]